MLVLISKKRVFRIIKVYQKCTVLVSLKVAVLVLGRLKVRCSICHKLWVSLCCSFIYFWWKPLKIYFFVQNIHITRTLLNWLFKRHYPIMYSLLGLNVSNSPQTLHKKWSLSLRISSVKISRKLRIWSYLLKKSLIENFILCAVKV